MCVCEKIFPFFLDKLYMWLSVFVVAVVVVIVVVLHGAANLLKESMDVYAMVNFLYFYTYCYMV